VLPTFNFLSSLDGLTEKAMRKRSGVFLLLAACALAAAALAVTPKLWLYRLPDPAKADREGLFRWLALRDLAQEPPATRRQLIARFEEELDRGLKISAATDGLDESYRARVRRNVRVLVGDWFRDAAARYAAAQGEAQTALLDAQAAKIERWDIVDLAFPPEPNAPPRGNLERLTAFEQWAQDWLAEAEPSKRPRLRRYLTALETRMLARHLPKLW
jgi:hypothetical protein